jgi:hypothetical protein
MGRRLNGSLVSLRIQSVTSGAAFFIRHPSVIPAIALAPAASDIFVSNDGEAS